jgi:hypothetical protein
MAKSPAFGRGFFDSVFSIADGIELSRNVDVFCFVYVRWVLDLTCDFAGEFRGIICKFLILFRLYGAIQR